MTKTPSSDDRRALRQQFRARRNALSVDEQHEASKGLLAQLLNHTDVFRARRIALYLANDGELNPQSVLNWCWQQDIQVCLPVLHPFCKGHLVFVNYTADAEMVQNRFGIPEPRCETTALVPLHALDVILTPLVAFDSFGNRLGMGGGFYDRTLAPIRRDSLNIELIGIAHDCQQAERLPTDSWDIPLRTIVTPTRVISCT